jgi:hypothetical protein
MFRDLGDVPPRRKLTPEQQAAVEHEARTAAAAGISTFDACRWPFNSIEGVHWLAVYYLTIPHDPR